VEKREQDPYDSWHSSQMQSLSAAFMDFEFEFGLNITTCHLAEPFMVGWSKNLDSAFRSSMKSDPISLTT
jgi:hypothetical protein